MPIKSKYRTEQIEVIMQDLQAVLQTHHASVDLALLALGNLATHIINSQVPEDRRQDVATSFGQALKQSVRVDERAKH
jgi:uncharacterized protein YejL (UPF0352 family)